MGIQGKEVLIIDDAADSRRVSRALVENVGMIAIEAETVEDGLAVLGKKTPHLILLDLKMLGLSGFDFLARKSRLGQCARIPVIVLSGDSDKESIYRALTLGAADYAIKPISAPSLIRRIKKALKDGGFKSFTYPAASPGKGSIAFPAEISRPGETDFYLESSVKIAAGTSVRLTSTLLHELTLGDCRFISTGKPNLRGADGGYFTRVNAMGLPRALVRIFKKAGAA